MIIAKWVLVAVFLSDGVPVESGMLGTANEEDCKVAREISIKHGHGKGLDVWAECREVAPIVPKPKGEPGTEQRS
jgi:hypothetical protein